MKDEQWSDAAMRCFGMLIDVRAQPTGIKKRDGDSTTLIVFNAAAEGAKFTLPECPGGENWTLLADTNLPDGEEETYSTGDVYVATGRSVLVFGHPNEAVS